MAADADRAARLLGDHITWDSSTFHEIPRFHISDLDTPAGKLRWLDTIWIHGVAILAGVTPDRAHLTELAHLIGEVQPSNYGVDWELRTVDDPATPVYSDDPLRVHTDLPYRDLPPSVQFILVAQADAGGGESLLVDGYRVAEEVRVAAPDSWVALTRAEWTYRYADSRYDVRGGGPIIGRDRAGRYDVIRHAPGLVMPSPDHAESGPAGAAGLLPRHLRSPFRSSSGICSCGRPLITGGERPPPAAVRTVVTNYPAVTGQSG